jgi:hypothetical protein
LWKGLQRLIVPPRAHSRYASPLVFAGACEMGLEGIVSKHGWITYRRRSADGDLFLGPYPALIAALTGCR